MDNTVSSNSALSASFGQVIVDGPVIEAGAEKCRTKIAIKCLSLC